MSFSLVPCRWRSLLRNSVRRRMTVSSQNGSSGASSLELNDGAHLFRALPPFRSETLQEEIPRSDPAGLFSVLGRRQGLGSHMTKDDILVRPIRSLGPRCSLSSGLSEKFKIYTKTGDRGESSLYDGQRRRKDDPTFDALGDVDELNSALGLAHEYCFQIPELAETRLQIEEVQSRLLDAGSAVATPLNSLSSKKLARVKFNPATVEVLEKWIDKMDEELPQLTSFILPSGGLPAASLHLARSICRRAERKVVTLADEQLVDRSVAQYLNRLSDYLFTAARFAAFKLEKPENVWTINKR